MSSKRVELAQGSSEWLAWRKGGLGGSDSPAVLGKSPYLTARDLWFEKAGLAEPPRGNEYVFQKGHETEQKVRELFFRQTNIEMRPACFQNGSIFRASLDGHDRSYGNMEAKLVGNQVLKKAKGGEIPEHHRIQIQHGLYVSEMDKCYWCGHDGKANGVVIEIGRDEKLIAEIVAKGLDFWGMLERNEPPPLTARDTLFLTDPEAKKIFSRLKKIKEQKDLLDALYSELEQQVKSLSSHPRYGCEGVMVSLVERAGSIDYSKVPELREKGSEYLESFRKRPSSYKRITFGGE